MKECIDKILSEYSIAYQNNDSSHAILNVIKTELPNAISEMIGSDHRFIVKGSAGIGNLAGVPWVGIFDPLVTTTAQSGYYPVYLFRHDMTGVYLSMNQGVTEIKKKFKRKAMDYLHVNAENLRAQISVIPKGFDESQILLKRLKNTKSDLPKSYEFGNVISKFYPVGGIPSDSVLKKDLQMMLKVYENIYYNENIPVNDIDTENDEERYIGHEDRTKFRIHKSIERNRNLAKKVKKAKGYTCEACDFPLTKTYGNLGKNYIEAHHLIPFSKLDLEKIKLNAIKDFAVLCANCHRMIHRLDDPSNLDLLKDIIKSNKTR